MIGHSMHPRPKLWVKRFTKKSVGKGQKILILEGGGGVGDLLWVGQFFQKTELPTNMFNLVH